MKVEIGSKYEGPSWDRPCLRQMPREWTLEETRKTWWQVIALWVWRLVRG
jgi:hypothetical protein